MFTDCTAAYPPEVGVVSGGHGFAEKVFHTRCNCRMNLYKDTFCLVCRDKLTRALSPFLPLADYDSPRRETPALWVVLDSVLLRGGPSGRYQLQYMISTGRDTISGFWPPEGQQYLPRGRITEVGDLLAQVPLPRAATALTVKYTLLWITTEQRTVITTASARVPTSDLTTGITVVKAPAILLNLGLIVPR
jgi:hypothetical protein